MDFGAARILVTGSGTRTSDSRTFAGRAEIRQIPIDKLGDYWPLEFATGGREWAMTNLSKGALDVAAEFALSSPVDDISAMKVDRLVGLLDYGGMTVQVYAAYARAAGRLGVRVTRTGPALRCGAGQRRRPEGYRWHHRTCRPRQRAAADGDLAPADQQARRRMSSVSWRGPSSGCPRTCSTTIGDWEARPRSTCR